MGGWLPVLALLAIYMRDHLGSSVLAAMATILVIQTVASVVSLFAGSFASRWGGRLTLLIGTAGMMGFAGLLSLIREGWHVIALAPLAGLVVPFFWTGTSTY
ncbi:MAG: MFS transporter, partial [Chloroflexi bacterium]|nr:MFS transporter [Chloroflexota bacterium]